MKEKVPTYFKLKKKILKDIESGSLVPGDVLPSERALAAMHGLSRMTVRQALTDLVNAGILYREQGRGTFVSARKMQQRNISSFSETVREMGFTPSTKVIEFAVIKPPEDIAAKLMIKDSDVYRALRVRLADTVPVAVEEVFIPFQICPGLVKKDLQSSLYTIINKTFGHRVGSADCSVSTHHPTSKQQEYLNISRNTPVLKIDSLYYSVSGITLYYEKAIYRADMYEVNFRITTQ
ncbi:MAG: GntR family transcriptional regulator [Burkholderiales bacterium]